jgi:hypothetical protein
VLPRTWVSQEKLQLSSDLWDKLARLPFSDELIAELKSDVVQPVLKPTQHATNIAEGRREYAIDLLIKLGAL